MRRTKSFIEVMLEEKNKLDLLAVKKYCEEDGYVEDYYNIFLPLYKKYGWEFIRDIGEISWNRLDLYHYEVVYLNLDRLSTLVEWNEKKGKYVAI